MIIELLLLPVIATLLASIAWEFIQPCMRVLLQSSLVAVFKKNYAVIEHDDLSAEA